MPLALPARAANAQFSASFTYPYVVGGTAGAVRDLSINNPSGNAAINEVDVSIDASTATAVTAGACVDGFIGAGCGGAVGGSGPWTIVYTNTAGNTILPQGAAGHLSLTFTPVTETTAGVAESHTVTVTVTYAGGGTQQTTTTMTIGRATTVTATLVTASPQTVATAISFTAATNVADSGIPLKWISTPTVGSVATAGFSAAFSPSTTTTSATGSVATSYTSTEAQAYTATARIAATYGSDANGLLAPTASGSITLNPSSPTQVTLSIAAYDQTGHTPDYVSGAAAVPITIALADTYGNAVTAGGDGKMSFTALQGTLTCTGAASCAKVSMSAGILSGNNTVTYTPISPAGSHPLLAFGTFDLVSASLTPYSTSVYAGSTFAGSSKSLSMGYAYTGTAPPTPTWTVYTPSVGGTAATGTVAASNVVAGTKVNLAVTLTGGSGVQSKVPVNFTLTSTSLTVPYTGTFSNGKSWVVVTTSSLGVATANFTSDTTATDAVTAVAVVSSPKSVPTYSTSHTDTSAAATGALTTIAAAGSQLKISTYSDTGLTTASSYVKPGGHLYLNIKLQDQYGNSVTWGNAFALQISLSSSAGGLSATTVYITNGKLATFDSGYQVQFTAPSTLGTVTLSASTTQSGIAAGSKTVHVVSISPSVSLTTGSKTALTANTVAVNATGVPSLASPAGTVVINFKYSLNGAANSTVGISSTNSSGASFASFSVKFNNGTNTMKIYATDSNGNVGVGTFTFTVTHPPPGLVFSSPGASSTSSGGFTGVNATFTNTGSSSVKVNVYFVWYNSANQVVSVGAQLNVVFAAHGSASFFNSYQASGHYTVKVFIQDAAGNALSTSYSASVTIA